MHSNVVGVGVDIEEVSRFRKLSVKKNASFLKRVFTKKELNYCFSKRFPERHLAARFAAKEAVVKSLSLVFKPILNYARIEVILGKKGVPSIKFIGEKVGFKVFVSLAHCNDTAIAFALVVDGGIHEKGKHS